MKITGGEAIIQSLICEGVKVVFGYPGGAIMPFYNDLYDHHKDEIHHVLVRHEQGAAHAAEGYAHMTGKPGVCISTSGPGATNLVTGIADAMMDSVPLVCITGQVGASVVGTDAFQEVDVIGVTAPITKWNYQITTATEIPYIMKKAFHIAETGRPGPVVVDITKNAQFEQIEFKYPQTVEVPGYKPVTAPNDKQIQLAANLLNNAKKPLMLIGHGVLIAHAEKEVLRFMEKSGIPVASTLLGLSSIPTNHPLYVGFLGMHGNYAPNMLTNKTDVLFAVGMRFDDRVTSILSDYAKQAKVIHIDIDPAELNKNVMTEIPIVADAKLALKQLIPLVKKNNHSQWIKEFRKLDKIEHETVIKNQLANNGKEIKMAEVIDYVSKITKGNAIIVTDVGQNQMMAARYFQFRQPNQLITSGGAGTMGYGVPAAIGAQFAAPKKLVVAFVGDGGFQMTVQELGTIMQEKLPIKIILLNNEYLGMVRQWQQMFFDKRYSFTHMHNPDFMMLVKSYGIQAKQVSNPKKIKAEIKKALSSPGPYVLEVMVKKEDCVFPMVPTGASVSQVRLE